MLSEHQKLDIINEKLDYVRGTLRAVHWSVWFFGVLQLVFDSGFVVLLVSK